MAGSKIGIDSKGRRRIRVVFPVPPSDNKIYTNSIVRIGKRTIATRALSQKARAFKKRAMTKVVELSLKNPLEFKRDIEYECIIKVYLDKVYNTGWPKNAKFRYKKVDSQNRAKLVIDAVTEVIGVDDCHIFSTRIEKFEDKKRPRLVIIIREREVKNA